MGVQPISAEQFAKIEPSLTGGAAGSFEHVKAPTSYGVKSVANPGRYNRLPSLQEGTRSTAGLRMFWQTNTGGPNDAPPSYSDQTSGSGFKFSSGSANREQK